MKAMRYHAYGDKPVYEEADRPAAGTGQVVLQVAGTAYNPVDVGIHAGALRQVFPVTFPHTPGIDVSGVITELGDGVTGWAVGDQVVAFLPMNEPGAAAEFVVAPAAALATAPRTVDLADAAALPSSALTARQALLEDAGLHAGQTVLINGAGGAVGGYAIQLAKQAGAVVTATASPRSIDRVRSYQPDQIIEHTTTALTDGPYDVVFNVAPTDSAQLADLVADGGVLITATTPGPEDPGRGVRSMRVSVRSDGERLAELVGLVDAGAVRIDVAQRRPLADLPAVYADPATVSGKLVFIP
jgi:NADPH:quinone reductase-like Zn-dependent oxidoreductase